MAGGNGAAARLVLFFAGLLIVPLLVAGDDPYRFFTWTVTYGDIYPLGVKQQVRLSATLLCGFGWPLASAGRFGACGARSLKQWRMA